MNPLNLVAAALVIMGQGEPDDNLKSELRIVGLSWQLLENRELPHTFSPFEGPQTFIYNVEMIQKRYERYKNEMSIENVARFPNREIIEAHMKFNRDAKAHFEVAGVLNPDYQSILNEYEHLWNVWYTLREAKMPYYLLWVRRDAALKLRELLGDEAFYNGTMPPHVPTWRFHAFD